MNLLKDNEFLMKKFEQYPIWKDPLVKPNSIKKDNYLTSLNSLPIDKYNSQLINKSEEIKLNQYYESDSNSNSDSNSDSDSNSEYEYVFQSESESESESESDDDTDMKGDKYKKNLDESINKEIKYYNSVFNDCENKYFSINNECNNWNVKCNVKSYLFNNYKINNFLENSQKLLDLSNNLTDNLTDKDCKMK